MIVVHEGEAHDVAAIMPIMNEAFDPDFGERWTASQCVAMLSLPDSSLLLTTYNGNYAGFALSRWVMDEEELLMIGVAKNLQKNGIGSHMIHHIIHRARVNDRQKIFLEVRDNNSARNFYYRLGFVDIGRRKNYYAVSNGNLLDAVTMSLKI
jgi:[ribosomal protein S18]-alanine N-acetyltransferase